MEVVHLLALTVVVVLPQAQCDLALFAVHFDDLGFELVANLEPVLQPAGSVHSCLADVDESLHAAVQLHENAEVGQLRDFAASGVADLVLLGNLALPGVGRELLVPQRQSLLLFVDLEDHGFHLLALLEDLGGMLYVLGPGHVGDVDQAIHAFVQPDERAEIREALDLSLDLGADRVLRLHEVPGIRRHLLHPERDLAGGLVHIEHLRFHLRADGDDLGRVPDFVRPAHLGDVDEAFHTRLQLDEGAVIGQADHPALDPGADRILGGDAHPGIGALLLQTERDAAGLAVILENHHFDTVADHVDLRRMADAAPRHIGDVEEPVDPAEVHERAVICDVLDGAVHELAFGEVRQGPLPALVARFLEQEPAGHDHVAAPLVDLDDLHGEGLADELFGVTHRMQVDLGAGQEGFYADVHHHPALDAADDPAFDNGRSEEHTSELQSRLHLVCRLLLEKKKTIYKFGHSRPGLSAFPVLLSTAGELVVLHRVPHHDQPPDLEFARHGPGGRHVNSLQLVA